MPCTKAKAILRDNFYGIPATFFKSNGVKKLSFEEIKDFRTYFMKKYGKDIVNMFQTKNSTCIDLEKMKDLDIKLLSNNLAKLIIMEIIGHNGDVNFYQTKDKQPDIKCESKLYEDYYKFLNYILSIEIISYAKNL